ncbi:MAG: hypothetical protein ACM3Q4_02185 [Acidobacteriota bacterium]
MKSFAGLLLSVVCISKLFAASPSEEIRPYACSPRAALGGAIVFTDNYASALYLRLPDGTEKELASSPGSGLYYTLSFDRASIGMKYIGAGGLQAPAVIDAASGAMRLLAPPSRHAGQVSFARDGRIAYTLGTRLIVEGNASRKEIELGSYANIAPISPDGTLAAFNTETDQIMVVDLATGAIKQITAGPLGYFQPQWSPDDAHLLYSSLNGHLFLYDRTSGATTELGEGYAPAWSDDGQSIAFYRKEVADGVLVNTDLYLASADGLQTRRLTATPNECEMDPSFVPGTPSMLFQTYTQNKIGQAVVSPAQSGAPVTQSIPVMLPVSVAPHFASVPSRSAASLDVPYINQVYDTPDWFNGHSACGPTTAMMALAYFKILPAWPVTCTWPSPHTSNWGMYISESYWYNGMMFNLSAKDPNGRLAQGAFGHMWGAGSPYSRMSGFYKYHGIQSETFDAPSHASAAGEILAGNLYSICNGLTTAGHLIQAHGIDASESHTVIVNDPYGNKNKPGYPNNFGKDAKYDWPGYNNGNQNLNTVYWASTVHYTAPADADSIVDDASLYHGFSLFVKPGLPMSLWKEKPVGYNGHFWYAFTTYSDSVDSCYAQWRPTLDKSGRYELLVSLPRYNAAFASVAKYKIYAKDGLHTVRLNQNASKSATADTLVSLGTFVFEKGKSGYVQLGDASGIKNEALIFDAILWKYKGEEVTGVRREDAAPSGYELRQNYPNPFNPSTTITYALPAASRITLSVVDVLGRECAVLASGMQSAGVHEAVWNADRAPGGIYFCRLQVTTADGSSGSAFSDIKKMLLVK